MLYNSDADCSWLRSPATLTPDAINLLEEIDASTSIHRSDNEITILKNRSLANHAFNKWIESFAFTKPHKIHFVLYKRSVKSHRKIRISFPFHRPSRRPCLHAKSFRNSSTMKVRVFPLSIVVRKSSQYQSPAVRRMHFSTAFEKRVPRSSISSKLSRTFNSGTKYVVLPFFLL